MDVFGTTVQGPAHLAEGISNQDAWLHARAGGMRVVVVSDGMGSRRYAREGAQAACRATVDAVRQWRRYPAAPPDVLLAMIHLFWRARIAPLVPSECACTCLFAAVDPDGSGLVGQLGDGLALVRDGDGLRPLQMRYDSDFGNETEALGVSRDIAAWATAPLGAGARTVVLCTDGVADDLLPDRFDTFVAWLEEEIGPKSPQIRWRALAAALRDWPTPNHLDDKTIAMLQISRRKA